MEYTYEFLRKCHGLRFRAKSYGVPVEGIVKVYDAYVLLCYGKESLDFPESFNRRVTRMVDEEMPVIDSDFTDFEIGPRDPETYQDWQVGDKIAARTDDKGGEVIFRSGKLVICKDKNDGRASGPFTCEELFEDEDCRLVLTDIEEQIIEEGKKTELSTARTLWGQSFIRTGKIWRPQDGDICFVELIPEQQKLRAFKSEIKSDSTHEFKKFDPVLVRDSDGEPWRPGVFDSMRYKNNSMFKYTIMGCVPYAQCIPLNEKTEHLLGTTKDYKEEQP